MANGKGWLDCIDCIYNKVNNNHISICTKHDLILSEYSIIGSNHSFCSEFMPTKNSIKLLNGAIITENNSTYYYAYKPTSEFYNSKYNKVIQLKPKIIYSYFYGTPWDIEETVIIE